MGMNLSLEKIARNLNLSTSTAYCINARFERTGSVDPDGLQKRRPELRRLDERSERFVNSGKSVFIFRRVMPESARSLWSLYRHQPRVVC